MKFMKQLLTLSLAVTLAQSDTVTLFAKAAATTNSTGTTATAPIILPKATKVMPAQMLKIEKEDFVLGIGGKTKIEHFVQKNINFLNSHIPDEPQFFKNTFDLFFDLNYGQKTFNHNAVQACMNIRHKGIWGRGAVFADSDATAPTNVKLSETSFGDHKHTNGKPLMWIKDAWLKFSLNAVCNNKNTENIHTIKIGWHPFELGRGIALGSVYGINRDNLGLYSYSEDKSAPGITLSGSFIQDMLSYDLYYARFEGRSKSIGDMFNTARARQIGRATTPWRGEGKDDEVFAGRLKFKPLNKSTFGTLEFEPYVMYNEASDQTIEFPGDTKMELGAFGLGMEHSYKGFEWGAEAAMNFGQERVLAIDRNSAVIARDAAGFLVERYSYIGNVASTGPLLPNQTRNANITADSKTAAALLNTTNGDQISGTNFFNIRDKDGLERFRPAYKNELHGWMAVADAAYTFEAQNITLAGAYGFASGDSQDIHGKEVDKKHHGFIGLHEYYTGKRVSSVIILDERQTETPATLKKDDDESDAGIGFTDLQHVGFGTTWKPTCCSKKWSINPNVLGFWKASTIKKFDATSGKVTDKNARKYMGTEFNIITHVEIIQNLKVLGNLSFFVPGGFYTDVKGIALGNNDIYNKLSDEAKKLVNPVDYRLGDNTAYHINLGLEYIF